MLSQSELNHKKGLLTNDEIRLSELRENRNLMITNLKNVEIQIDKLTNKICVDFEKLWLITLNLETRLLNVLFTEN